MRIGVCIPCYAPHIPYLQYCLNSIENQTQKPTIVSISISSYTNKEQLPLASDYSFPILYTCTSMPQCAGKNRNVAAQAIVDQVDILSFFDADDLMHPKRLEKLNQAFTDYKLDSCVHYFTKGTHADRIRLSMIHWSEPTELVNTTGFTVGRDSVCGRVWWTGSLVRELGQCGHFSVKTSIWNMTKCVEGWGMGEDSEYVWRVVTSGANHGFIPSVLSMYI